MKKYFVMFLFSLIALPFFGQDKIDLFQLKVGSNCVVYNRTLVLINDGGKSGVSLNEQEGDGLVWLNDVTFDTGTIELDIRGKDYQGHSFVGLAFHGVDNKTFDAIYFRPFNFQSSERRAHSVQYISMPQYDWYKLRQDFPGKYENVLVSSVLADDWFHARIVVSENDIKVYVNNAETPSLVVHKLNDRKDGKLGLWVGNTSSGDFANLVITK